jgi:HEAT repeat protein
MIVSEHISQEIETDGTPDEARIADLILTLTSHNGVERGQARQRLVALGRLVTMPLVESLTSPNQHVRWEAAKALVELRDPRAAPALVQVLEDGNFAVRWLAAEALVALGHDALIPLLEALEKGSDSVWMREGAHHVLHTLIGDGVADEALPVLEALQDIEPVVEVPIAAYKVLLELRGTIQPAPAAGDDRSAQGDG